MAPSDLVAAMKSLTLDPRTLPLCPDRRPFEHYTAELCEQIAHEALTVPERRGRLTDAVRTIAGRPSSDPIAATTFEAHIGLTSLDADLLNDLAALGFEPHSFAGDRQPTGYHHNFTQQFVVERSNAGRTHLTKLLKDRTRAARELVQNHPGIIGFTEEEVYRHTYNRDFCRRTLAPESLRDFPNDVFTYRQIPLPTTQQEADETNTPLNSRRAADLHIKLAGYLMAATSEPLADRLMRQRASRSRVEYVLGERLLKAGFYEQISQSGNFLYTAHYAELADANRAFTALSAFAAQHGGITNVTREACTAFWRKAVVDKTGQRRLAPVPPLLISPCSPKTR